MLEGNKFDEGKPSLDLIEYEFLEELAKVLDYGASKYGRANWKHGLKYSRIISAAMRHLHKFNAGIDLDEETKLSHLAHVAANLMFLLYYQNHKKEMDDRYESS